MILAVKNTRDATLQASAKRVETEGLPPEWVIPGLKRVQLVLSESQFRVLHGGTAAGDGVIQIEAVMVNVIGTPVFTAQGDAGPIPLVDTEKDTVKLLRFEDMASDRVTISVQVEDQTTNPVQGVASHELFTDEAIVSKIYDRPPLQVDGVVSDFTVVGMVDSAVLTVKTTAPVADRHIEVWRSGSMDFSTAIHVADFEGSQFVDHNLGVGTRVYYWVRVVDREYGKAGLFIGPETTQTGDVTAELSALEGKLQATQLHRNLTSRIDLIDGPSTLVGSVSQKVKEEAEARAAAVAAEASLREQDALRLTQSLNEEAATRAADILAEAEARELGITTVDTRVTNEVSTLNSTITAVKGELDGNLTTAVTGLNTKITNVDGKVTTAAADISALRLDTSTALSTAVSSLDTKITNVDGKVDATATDLAALRLETDTDLASAVSSLTTKINKDVGLVSSAVDALETSTGANLSNAVNTLDTKIATVDGRVTTVANSVTALKAEQDADLASAVSSLTTQINNIGAYADSGVEAVSTDLLALKAEVDSDLAAATSSLTTKINTDVGAVSSSLTSLRNKVDGQISTALTDLSTDISTVDGRVNAVSSDLTALGLKVDNDIASATSTLTTKINTDVGVVSSGLNQLSTTVGGHTTTIQQQASSINGLEGQWMVRVDNNGKVAGIGLGSNPAGVSDFIVNTDRFSVFDAANPTQMVLGTQNGKTLIKGAYIDQVVANQIDTRGLSIKNDAGQVVFSATSKLNGANIQDGTITNAKIQNAAITNAKIGTAAVDTLQLKGQAVTIPTSAAISSSISFTGKTEVLAMTVKSSGAPVLITYSSVVMVDGSLNEYNYGRRNCYMELYIDGVRVSRAYVGMFTKFKSYAVSQGFGAGSISLRRTLGAGNHTVRMYIDQATSGGASRATFKAYNRSITCLEVKR